MLRKITLLFTFILLFIFNFILTPTKLSADNLNIKDSLSINFDDSKNIIKAGEIIYFDYGIQVSDGSDTFENGAYSQIYFPKK